MPDYWDSIKIGRVGRGSICEEIVDIAEDEIKKAIKLTEETGEEIAFGVAKAGDETFTSRYVRGTTDLLKKSVDASAVNDILRDANEWLGVDDARDFKEESDFLVILHTHPSQDPSPSMRDMGTAVKWWTNFEKMERDFISVISELPYPTGLGAIAKADDDTMLVNVMHYTGMKDRVIADIHGVEDVARKAQRTGGIMGENPETIALMIGIGRKDVNTLWEAMTEMVKAFGEFCDAEVR